MSFKEIVVGGVNLVRQAIQSPNYITGVSGWTIRRDGSAEFNNVLVRGNIDIGGAPNGEITSSTAGGVVALNFFTHAATESDGGRIFETTQGGVPNLQLESGEFSPTNGETLLRLGAPTATLLGQYTFRTEDVVTPVKAGPLNALISVGSDIQMQLANPLGISTSNNALVIGDISGLNLDFSGTEVAAFNGVNASTLYLNNTFGGGVLSPGMAQGTPLNFNTLTTTSTTFTNACTGGNLPSVTMPYPASGTITIAWSSAMSCTSDANLSFEVKDSPGGTVRVAAQTQNGITFKGAGTNGVTLTRVLGFGGLPTSGNMTIDLQALTTNGANAVTLFRTNMTVFPST